MSLLAKALSRRQFFRTSAGVAGATTWLAAEPHVELQDGPMKSEMVARELTGDEKVVWWKRAVEAYPDYADYQRRTERQIPVFVLEPAGR